MPADNLCEYCTMDPKDVLAFWFADGMQKRWFRSTPELDEQIRTRFESLWHRAANGEYDHWSASAEGALALVVVLDQLPLNMYRGTPKAFATEAKAVQIALDAVDAGLDQQLENDHQAFLYMPLMHSEDRSHQDRAVQLFEAAGLVANARFARHHRDLIRRFGRFPHRNAILGRASTPDELDYLASAEAFSG